MGLMECSVVEMIGCFENMAAEFKMQLFGQFKGMIQETSSKT